jgi:hypothetical protein
MWPSNEQGTLGKTLLWYTNQCVVFHLEQRGGTRGTRGEQRPRRGVPVARGAAEQPEPSTYGPSRNLAGRRQQAA